MILLKKKHISRHKLAPKCNTRTFAVTGAYVTLCSL